jgi:hypothetical protein
MNDKGDGVRIERRPPALRLGDIRQNRGEPIGDRCEVALCRLIHGRRIQRHETLGRIGLQPMPRQHAHDEARGAGHQQGHDDVPRRFSARADRLMGYPSAVVPASYSRQVIETTGSLRSGEGPKSERCSFERRRQKLRLVC